MRARGPLPRCAVVACVLLALGTFEARRASADEPTFESANAAFADGRFDEARDAFAQLAGGLAGERHRQHPRRIQRARLGPVGDAVGQHAGLARSGTGEDAQRRRVRQHRRDLVLVHAAQEPVGLGCHRGERTSAR